MPWMEETVVEQRLRFVLRVREEGVSVAEACREFDISRPTGYKWLKRYEREGLEGLSDRSRAPQHIPHKTDEKTEELICSLRKTHSSFGPKKLRAWLQREHPDGDWPAASTIGEILKRNGLVEPRNRKRKTPPRSEPLAEADAPNRIWSADFKGEFQLGDGILCYPLTITDNYSRIILGCYAFPSTKGKPVKKVFKEVFTRWGLPDAIRTDNGTPFASTAPQGVSRLSAWWMALGIVHERIDVGQPQQNGRHERMHLTLKQETARPGAEDMVSQQERFNSFVSFFNDLRPHEALGQEPPAAHHRRSEKSYPEQLEPLGYPRCDLERSVKTNGCICFANQLVYVSEALRGHRVGLTEVDVDVWVVTFADLDLGLFESGESSLSALKTQTSTKRTRL